MYMDVLFVLLFVYYISKFEEGIRLFGVGDIDGYELFGCCVLNFGFFKEWIVFLIVEIFF